MTRAFTDDEDARGASDPVVLGDRYELTELLGRGGMAEVYRARDRLLQRTVAVKLLPEDRRHDDTDSRRLQDEAMAAAGLSHPHVIAVHDVGSSPRGVYVVMELLGGRTWADEQRERGRVPGPEAARVGAAVARALAHAHERGIVHRDVNPSNVMLLADGTPKLMDFGIARIDDVGGLTETGRVVGTAAYMSPEQVRGSVLDGRSDVYSLGCALYEVVTGSLPFRGLGSADVAAVRLREPPTPLRQVAPGVPVALEGVVLRAMSLDPQDRPDATALAAALQDLAERGRQGSRPTQTLKAQGPDDADDADGATTEVRADDDDAGSGSGSDERPATDDPPRSSSLRFLGIALVVLGVLALAVCLLLGMR